MKAVEIHQLCKTYPNGLTALHSINLIVRAGDFFSLLGVNGAGKSTTIGLISTLLTKTSGSIYVHGHNIDTDSELAKSCLGIVPQEVNLNVFETCEEILLNQAGYYGMMRGQARPRAELLLHQLGLDDKRTTIARYLSGGMKRRLMIARSLMHQPKVLILDEPTAGVDIEIRRSVWDFLIQLNESGVTIILTTHDLYEAELLCKTVAVIDHGKIIENTSIQDLLKKNPYQILVLNTEQAIDKAPNIKPFKCDLIDQHTLEVKITKFQSINDAFALLTEQGIKIYSMRNKTNRLETLFLDLINHAN